MDYGLPAGFAMAVMALWVLAIVAGLTWRRWAAIGLSALTVLVWFLTTRGPWAEPMGWIQLAVVGMTPWWIATLRARVDKRLRRLLHAEAVKLSDLKVHQQRLLELQGTNQRLESQIAQITDLYHVTKQTAKAVHVDELFRRSLEVIPRLLTVRGLRLIDTESALEHPLVLRAVRGEQASFDSATGLTQDSPERSRGTERVEPRGDREPLTIEAPAPLLPFERAILNEVLRRGQSGVASRDQGFEGWPPTLSTIAWAPFWHEQRPIGVLLADELPSDQMTTLSIVANQLALQLSRVHFYQAVESMAVTDTLTGLFVRRYFMELAVEELQRSRRHGLSCACLLVDLDEFKQKNDTYGHLTGDVVLREVAQLMRRNLREVDLIARFGGEEFVLLLVETSAEPAMAVAQRLRQLVEVHPIRAYDEVLRQTISMGLSIFPDDGDDLQQLIDRADGALYAAKRAGRNRVVHWSPSR